MIDSAAGSPRLARIMRRLLPTVFLPPLFSAPPALAAAGPVAEASGAQGWLVILAVIAALLTAFIVMVEFLSRRGLSSAPRTPRRFRVMAPGQATAPAPVRKVSPPAIPVKAAASVRKPVADAPVRAVPAGAARPRVAAAIQRVRIVDTGFWLDGTLAGPGERVVFRWTDADGEHTDSVDFTPGSKTGGHFVYTGRRATRVEVMSSRSLGSGIQS